ncbi:quinolinate synthase NadA [Pontiella sulfatireligans]|uniref:Quinolinate synthase n=1 Tax=Pontiella sulfatireligans TaxID=2750658 RepID=A0A6C2UE55_9BACT|nr:quinolinate synthase NadA [Pontiella sulfatireligans]VGO18435.1 Quinolinate synthase A [Pontiella sulfatireligans]
MQTIEDKIQELKRERGAIIIAHNYQPDEVQAIADFTGDSLELSRKAAELDEEVIVFCGVHFMAETAAILSPEKTILLPDQFAGCPMADMITAEQLRKKKAEHPGAVVICYVNSSAAVKAECDLCCTSSNAMAIARSVPVDKEIIFVPDTHLGHYIQKVLGREMIIWDGYCPTHSRIRDVDIVREKKDHPNAVVMAHPECPLVIRDLADYLLSTGQMCTHAAASDETEFIIATEMGLLYRLRNENPEKKFYAVSERALCPNMKKIDLEKVLWALEDMQHRIVVPEPTCSLARKSIEAMLELS